MGIKASTANGGQSSPRARTFSTSSSSDVVSAGAGAPYELSSASPETDSSSAEDAAAAAAASAASLALGRVYAATSLPAHIWSLNGKSHGQITFRILFTDDVAIKGDGAIPF